MSIVHTGSQRLLLRVIFYIVVIVIIYLVRGGLDWRQLLRRVPGYAATDTTLIIVGGDLAPQLVQQLAANYRQDYPQVNIRVQGGGSSHALEALINDRADVAILNRRPTPEEQELFRSTHGDTLPWYPIALAGIVLLQSEQAGVTALTLDDLRGFVATGQDPRLERLYVADPNLGLWDAFQAALADSPTVVQAFREKPSPVVFLLDDTSVLAAVQADARALGLISSLTAPDDLAAVGVGRVPLRVAADRPPVSGSDAEVAGGAYPLYHHILVACLAGGSLQGGKFVTHATSDRGQRQIARAGFVPSRLVLRQIYLTRHPVDR